MVFSCSPAEVILLEVFARPAQVCNRDGAKFSLGADDVSQEIDVVPRGRSDHVLTSFQNVPSTLDKMPEQIRRPVRHTMHLLMFVSLEIRHRTQDMSVVIRSSSRYPLRLHGNARGSLLIF